MNRQNQLPDELLVKYLLGAASATEDAQVTKWINESPENKNEFDTFRLIWEQSLHVAPAPAVDEQQAWARFQQRIAAPQPAKKTIPLRPSYKWLRVAAVLLLLAGGGWLVVLQNGAPVRQVATAAIGPAAQPAPAQPAVPEPAPAAQNNVKETAAVTRAQVARLARRAIRAERKQAAAFAPAGMAKITDARGLFKTSSTKEFICNGTPCPIEICIVQTVKCRNDRPSAISTCSLLEPDQSGQLRYKAFNKIAKNCKATIDEIRITSVSTGETIVLNDHSTPSTAQDFFDHITGKEKGDVLAGMFHTNCNNQADNCGLTFDSNYGNLILQ